MTENQQAYLMRLVRMDIRKQRKNISRLRMRPDQDREEYERISSHFAGKLRFCEETYRVLGGEPGDIATIGTDSG